MINKKLIISITIFSVLLFFTSVIKNKTRIIEKNISNSKIKIAVLEKEIYETQLDFFYLSSPKMLTEKINFLSVEDYTHLKISQIYLSYEKFLNQKKQLSEKKDAKEQK